MVFWQSRKMEIQNKLKSALLRLERWKQNDDSESGKRRRQLNFVGIAGPYNLADMKGYGSQLTRCVTILLFIPMLRNKLLSYENVDIPLTNFSSLPTLFSPSETWFFFGLTYLFLFCFHYLSLQT